MALIIYLLRGFLTVYRCFRFWNWL